MRKYITALFSIIVTIGILRGLFLLSGLTHSDFHMISKSLTPTAKSQHFSVKSGLRFENLLIRRHHLRLDLSANAEYNKEAVHFMFIFFQSKHDKRLQQNVYGCLSSLFKNAESIRRFAIHVVGDQKSFVLFQAYLEKIKAKENITVQVIQHNLDDIPDTIQKALKDINSNVGKIKHDFSQPYFYLSLFTHRILPRSITRLIMLDVDLVVQSDIGKLYNLFDKFTDANFIGIARENQPTYRYQFYEFRQANPKTRVGGPPPDGLTGFNSGVILLDLKKMRKSLEYHQLLSNGTLAILSAKYKFQGNLGDQDVFTLMSLEHEHLFYTLPCGWNRQLCRWWQKADFEQVFDSYFSCNEQIHIVHGNCHTSVETKA